MCPESSTSIPSLPKMGEMRKNLRKRSWGGRVQRSVRAYQLGKTVAWTGKGEVVSVNRNKGIAHIQTIQTPIPRPCWGNQTPVVEKTLDVCLPFGHEAVPVSQSPA